jgi:proteasome lid subunit RPN8/RPN11
MDEAFTLRIRDEFAAKIRVHGAETYPYECCGAVLGRSGAELEVASLSEKDGTSRNASREVLGLFPLINRRDDSPRNRFRVIPEDVMEAEKSARSQGWEILGWYHSHPDHPALPSAYDRDHAWPWYSYIIVNVTKGEPQDLTSWRLTDDRSRFVPEGIEIRSGAEAGR